jgi:hypothetical protein
MRPIIQGIQSYRTRFCAELCKDFALLLGELANSWEVMKGEVERRGDRRFGFDGGSGGMSGSCGVRGDSSSEGYCTASEYELQLMTNVKFAVRWIRYLLSRQCAISILISQGTVNDVTPSIPTSLLFRGVVNLSRSKAVSKWTPQETKFMDEPAPTNILHSKALGFYPLHSIWDFLDVRVKGYELLRKGDGKENPAVRAMSRVRVGIGNMIGKIVRLEENEDDEEEGGGGGGGGGGEEDDTEETNNINNEDIYTDEAEVEGDREFQSHREESTNRKKRNSRGEEGGKEEGGKEEENCDEENYDADEFAKKPRLSHETDCLEGGVHRKPLTLDEMEQLLVDSDESETEENLLESKNVSVNEQNDEQPNSSLGNIPPVSNSITSPIWSTIEWWDPCEIGVMPLGT